MNRNTPIIPTLLAALALLAAHCAPPPLKTAPPPGAKATWEGRWASSLFPRSSGGLVALFPDPVPRGGGFTVEVTVSYGEGGARVRTSLTTVMAGEFDAASGTLRLKGSLAETGLVVEYTAAPDRDFTECTGDYVSRHPDDRGTFFLRKKR